MAPSVAELSNAVFGVDRSRFAADIDAQSARIDGLIAGARVLVVGGAGTIGAATTAAIAPFGPAALHVVDHAENALAELVRDLRSRALVADHTELRTLPIDFGSPLLTRFLAEQPRYDVVLNFAALKHVRSEKDVPSLLQMLDTNLLKAAGLLEQLERTGFAGRYFCVSTDKAANPVNLMGASKRAMEHFVFSGEIASGLTATRTSARFANVAFSAGSLLESFLQRLAKRQPLAAPADARRFFVTIPESGDICLLAAACAADRQLLVPRAGVVEMLDLVEVATRVLTAFGLEPEMCTTEDEARAAVAPALARGRYPLLVTPLDTSGEKEYEEFVGSGERTVRVGLAALEAVPYLPAGKGVVSRVRAAITRAVHEPATGVDKDDVVAWMRELCPELEHRETGRTLDARM